MKFSPVRTVKTLYALGVLVRDPDQLAKVFDMADALATPELLAPMVAYLSRDPQGARAFVERQRLDVDLAQLRLLPRGTLGREFADTMIANGLDPASLPTLPSTTDALFLRAHLYETHDVWHAVTGFATDWKSEIGLQAFYLAQIPGPLSAALVAVGCLRLAAYEMESRTAVMDAVVHGWTMGRRAHALFGVRWNDLWATPLADVRAMLNVDVSGAPAVAPVTPAKSAKASAASPLSAKRAA
jgi:ubiquinone biosynthesis protein COQ4